METTASDATQPGAASTAKTSFYSSLAQAIYTLHGDYEKGNRATLAALRKAAGKSPEKDPMAWSYALGLLPHFAYEGRGDTANEAETAAFTALTLYALHQRSLSRPMHQPNRSLGTVVAELTVASDSKSVKSRLNTLMLARTQAATHYHLRSLVNLLHAHEIPLDYAQLGSDLWNLARPAKRQGVILRWGRDYASAIWKTASSSEPSA